jgi:AraC family transcriptional regulator, activator of mtrCDE
VLLDRLLAHLDVVVEPYAVCSLRGRGRLQMPGTPRAQLHFVLAGRGELLSGSSREPVGSYALVLVPPGIDHTFGPGDEGEDEGSSSESAPSGVLGVVQKTAGSGEERLRLACGAADIRYGGAQLFARLREPLVEDFGDQDGMRRIFEALLAEQERALPGAAMMMRALMLECLVGLFRRLHTAEDGRLGWLTALHDPALSRAVDAMLAEPGAPHSLDRLAERAAMSRTTFSERFGAAFGRPPMAFLRDLRLREAAKLLQTTDLPVKAIAAKVGFASRSHFSRAFKAQFERDPGQFRAEAEP